MADKLNIINNYVNDHIGRVDLNLHVTMEMVTHIIWKNGNHLGAISASSLDPK